MTTTCQTCQQSLSRGDAVLRGDGEDQRAWHPRCFTFYRATKDMSDAEAVAEDFIGLSLSERLARAGYR